MGQNKTGIECPHCEGGSVLLSMSELKVVKKCENCGITEEPK